MQKLDIYTDGSSLGNPGPGGWAFFAVQLNGFKRGGKAHTTNNEMELMAIDEAISFCIRRGVEEVTIYTDSNYSKQGIETWMHTWKRNYWKTSSNSPVKNKDLWHSIYHNSKQIKLKVVKVKAHSGNLNNERVDQLAKEAAEKFKN